MISIRKAEDSDVDAIILLFEETVRHVNQKDYSEAQIEVWAHAKNRSVWKEKVLTQHFFIAQIDHQLVGFSSIEDSGYLDFMYVHKDFQGQGIAKALLDQIEKKSIELRLERIYASVSVTAQPFFKSSGFETYDQEHKELRGVAFTNALMEKVLL